MAKLKRQYSIMEIKKLLELAGLPSSGQTTLYDGRTGDAFDRPVTVNGTEVRPLDVLNALIARNMAENADAIPNQDSHEIHFAIGTGTIGEPLIGLLLDYRKDLLYEAYPTPARIRPRPSKKDMFGTNGPY